MAFGQGGIFNVTITCVTQDLCFEGLGRRFLGLGRRFLGLGRRFFRSRASVFTVHSKHRPSNFRLLHARQRRGTEDLF